MDTTERSRVDAARHLLIELAHAMHEGGAAAHRIEDAVNAVAKALSIEGASFFSTPTSLMICYAPGQTTLIRVRPSDVDLARLAALDDVADALLDHGRLTIAAARERIRATRASPREYAPRTTVVAFALVSFAVARSFGGGLLEMVVAGVLGGSIGLLTLRAERFPVGARALELFCAFFVGVAASAIAAVVPLSTPAVTLASLIVLFPGYTLTVAVAEIVTRNLVSGTSRLTAASLTLLQLGAGTALADRAARVWFHDFISVAPDKLPPLTEAAAVAAAAVGLSVLFQVPRRTIPWVLVACLIAFGGARFGAQALGPELGVGAGAFAVTATSNLIARWTRQSPLLTLVPAMVLLVPGSVGYRSMVALVKQDTVAGVGFAVSMLFIAVSIVAGMTVANATVSPRRRV